MTAIAVSLVRHVAAGGRGHLIACSFVAGFGSVSAAFGAGLCDVVWDGDKVAAAITGRPAYISVPLRDKQQRVTNLTAGQIQAFSEAKNRIGSAAGLSPAFVICSGEEPNAFATDGKDGRPLMGVTIGMLKLVNGDEAMAAAVTGHEFAHHTQGHRTQAATRDALLGLAGLLVGLALESKLQHRNPANAGLGQNLANLGSNLVSRKFDRDQEREADTVGFGYLVSARFNPNGAVRLAEKMNQAGGGGIGLFFDTHPGWPERVQRFQELIAENPQAQLLAASGGSRSSSPTNASNDAQVASLLPTYETTDAQRSYTAGLAAWRSKDISTAVRELRSAALAGYAPAQATVGFLYQNGTAGLPRDEAEAVRLYRLAAEQGNALGENNLGSMYLRGTGGLARDEKEAVRLYRLAADQGHPLAQGNLAALYMQGTGVPKDESEALRLARLSADQGNASGENVLGVMYLSGRGGLAKDSAEAARFFKLAADRGHAYGQANLAMMYLNGTAPLQKDESEAVRLGKLAAAQANPQGYVILGIAYNNGIGGLAKDQVEAVRLYRLSADQGNALGQANLGFMHLRGLGGLARNDAEALRLFRLSAAQGNALGQNNLGAMYESGLGGLPKSVDEAVSWYEKAAQQGNALAIKNLARLGRK